MEQQYSRFKGAKEAKSTKFAAFGSKHKSNCGYWLAITTISKIIKENKLGLQLFGQGVTTWESAKFQQRRTCSAAKQSFSYYFQAASKTRTACRYVVPFVKYP